MHWVFNKQHYSHIIKKLQTYSFLLGRVSCACSEIYPADFTGETTAVPSTQYNPVFIRNKIEGVSNNQGSFHALSLMGIAPVHRVSFMQMKYFRGEQCRLLPLAGLTTKEALGPEVADAQPEYSQLVQFGDDILRKWEQAGQALQLSIQAVPVPLGRVRFDTNKAGLCTTRNIYI